MDQLVGFLLHSPLSEIAKKLGKMLKYTPTFKVLSAPLIMYNCIIISMYTLYYTVYKYISYNNKDTRAGLPLFWDGLTSEALISFSVNVSCTKALYYL